MLKPVVPHSLRCNFLLLNVLGVEGKEDHALALEMLVAMLLLDKGLLECHILMAVDWRSGCGFAIIRQ